MSGLWQTISVHPCPSVVTQSEIGNWQLKIPPLSRPFVVENLTRNFLADFFHSFLDFFLFWFNVHSFAAWQAGNH